MVSPLDKAVVHAGPRTPGSRTLDEVLRAGEELRRRVHARTADARATHRRMTGGLKVVPLYLALRESVSASRARALAEEWRARPADEEAEEDEGAGEIASDVLYAVDALRALQRGYARAYQVILDQRRTLWNDEFSIRFEKGSDHRARAAIENAAALLPLDWVRLSNEAGKLKATLGRRGLYRSWPRRGHPSGEPLQPLDRALLRVAKDDLTCNALHEFVHRAQDVTPLAGVEREFYVRRTTLPGGARSPARPLQGYPRRELYRDGGFYTAYAGRDPTFALEDGPTYEILSTGLEALVGGDLETFELFLHHGHGDHEHEAFCLGALACL